MIQTLVENLSLTLNAEKGITINKLNLLPDDEKISKQKENKNLFPNFHKASFEVTSKAKLEIGSLIRLIFDNNNYGLVEIVSLETKDKITLVHVEGLFSPGCNSKSGRFNIIRFQNCSSATFKDAKGKDLLQSPDIYEQFSTILDQKKYSKVSNAINESLIKLMPIAYAIRENSRDYFFFSFTEQRDLPNHLSGEVIYNCRVLHSGRKYRPSTG